MNEVKTGLSACVAHPQRRYSGSRGRPGFFVAFPAFYAFPLFRSLYSTVGPWVFPVVAVLAALAGLLAAPAAQAPATPAPASLL